jgi:hypothetical protein
VDLCRTQESKKERVGEDEVSEYWRCTAIEPKTRLRVGRGIGQTETQAAIALWTQIKQRAAHRNSPPPVLSDGWDGHREAFIEVHGHLPPSTGRGRPLARKQPGVDWHYTQMVKQRDATRNLIEIDRRVIYGDDTALDRTGTRTTCLERTNLTSRYMNGRLVLKTLGYSKRLEMLESA